MPADLMVRHLGRALHEAMERDPSVLLLGEDVLDPYGGAFKVTRGLSERFPDRVITTPISEAGIVGVAGGLSMLGDKVVVEVMFADFLTLAVDQIVNGLAKSVAMYGRRAPVHVVVRAASGGRRGYGPTHSQSPQKHFIGVPYLHLYELSPFHDSSRVFAEMLELGEPCLHFEDKTLYGTVRSEGPLVDGLFRLRFPAGPTGPAWLTPEGEPHPECVLIAPGGLAARALEASRRAFAAEEVVCGVLVPTRLHPWDLGPVAGILAHARRVVVAEESVGGGTWGADVAHAVHNLAWGTLREPVRLVHSVSEVIPAAPHLEEQVLVQTDHIVRALLGGFHA
ncbi:alpha-ketoacid dehydrogenase subunit beta [Actinacidiphila bryophytorum]|uniref:alpha-ketoacid dehydrogenase subunit beta n=1 Tax=Actinacidiphila bryophytorum TaxID=1436133 RepID=UPI002176B5E6|nr:transketolase C-terminal domain-containing protein [Actinacidiphila bryophytorum]UWE08641.1 alpha-ketoacid dehydrogenase subunit beta [Actinacidiphila bryophytorum]